MSALATALLLAGQFPPLPVQSPEFAIRGVTVLEAQPGPYPAAGIIFPHLSVLGRANGGHVRVFLPIYRGDEATPRVGEVCDLTVHAASMYSRDVMGPDAAVGEVGLILDRFDCRQPVPAPSGN